MKTDINRAEDNTITLKITYPWKDIQKVREEVENDMVKNIKLPGFREGKVPPKIAIEKLDKEKVNEETLKRILPDAYVKAVKEHNINPMVNPRIHVEAFDEGTDLVFSAQTAEEPTIDLKNYKEEIKKVTAKSKIIIPGKSDPLASEAGQKPNLEEIIDALIKSTDVKVSDIIVDYEVNRLLSQFIDELKALGLSLEQYLASKGLNAEQLREEYRKRAEKDLKLEFLLRKIADTEKISVDQKDIDEVIGKIQDENQKKELLSNKYLLSAIIRQQKTLDFLSKI